MITDIDFSLCSFEGDVMGINYLQRVPLGSADPSAPEEIVRKDYFIMAVPKQFFEAMFVEERVNLHAQDQVNMVQDLIDHFCDESMRHVGFHGI